VRNHLKGSGSNLTIATPIHKQTYTRTRILRDGQIEYSIGVTTYWASKPRFLKIPRITQRQPHTQRSILRDGQIEYSIGVTAYWASKPRFLKIPRITQRQPHTQRTCHFLKSIFQLLQFFPFY